MLNNVTQIGLRIKEKREKLGLKQQTFAEKIKIDKSTLNRYEKGVQTPSLENIVAVAEGLNTSIDYLVYGEGNSSVKRSTSEETSGLYKAFKAMATLIEYGLVTVDDNDAIDSLILNLKKNPLLLGFFDEITNLCRCKSRFDSKEFDKAIDTTIKDYKSKMIEQNDLEMSYGDMGYSTMQEELYNELFESIQEKNKRTPE